MRGRVGRSARRETRRVSRRISRKFGEDAGPAGGERTRGGERSTTWRFAEFHFVLDEAERRDPTSDFELVAVVIGIIWIVVRVVVRIVRIVVTITRAAD